MKKVKFRIWNGQQMETNIMAGFLGAFFVMGLDDNDSVCMSHFNTKYPDETPLMQFTGIVDENDKEIYEGDICKYKDIKGVISWERQGCAFVLKWDEKGENGRIYHRYKKLTNIFSDGELYQCDYLEIIGNIYEDTELLN